MVNNSGNETAVPTGYVRGFRVYTGLIPVLEQNAMVNAVREVLRQAPLFRPVTSSGRAMSVRMTSAGRYGWISDRSGYRYDAHHPSGVAWPAIPVCITKLWEDVTGLSRKPDCCLINFYDQEARMGLHQDRDEVDFSWPVLSISLGDDARFRIGGTVRGGKTESLILRSGDVVLMGGKARLTYHGIDRIYPDTSTLLAKGGRINLTLRVVD